MKILLKHANIYGGDTADILVEDGKITGIGSFDDADEIRDMSGYAAVLPGVIDAATITAARLCKIDDQVGSIEVGKNANVIAVKDPIDETFEALSHVEFVMNRGKVIKA